jgi:hypothetical protein
MSPLRRLLALVGLILLVVSLIVLAASFWPAARLANRQPIADFVAGIPFPGVSIGDVTPVPTAEPGEPTPQPESRSVELDYPLSLRLGDSEVIRLALVISSGGITATTEGDGQEVTSEPIQIPNLYDAYNAIAIARLDSVGLNIDRPGDLEQPLLPGEPVTWRWTISASETGRQKANLLIHLRFIPKAGGDVLQKELWARTLTIQTADVFGLPAAVAKGLGLFGAILGSLLSFPFAEKFYSWLWRRIRRQPKTSTPNP